MNKTEAIKKMLEGECVQLEDWGNNFLFYNDFIQMFYLSENGKEVRADISVYCSENWSIIEKEKVIRKYYYPIVHRNKETGKVFFNREYNYNYHQMQPSKKLNFWFGREPEKRYEVLEWKEIDVLEYEDMVKKYGPDFAEREPFVARV